MNSEDQTPSVDSAVESWDSSNSNQHEQHEANNGVHDIPTNHHVQHRSTLVIQPSQMDRRSFYNERQFSCILHDNQVRSRNNPDSMRVHLKRDKRFLDFGFSISDRLYGNGVYVNKIRPNGPAQIEGSLIPRMRIYKVNQVDVTRMECNQVVPLLSSSPDDLVLEVGRRPAPLFDETDEFIEPEQDEEKPSIITSVWQSKRSDTNLNPSLVISSS